MRAIRTRRPLHGGNLASFRNGARLRSLQQGHSTPASCHQPLECVHKPSPASFAHSNRVGLVHTSSRPQGTTERGPSGSTDVSVRERELNCTRAARQLVPVSTRGQWPTTPCSDSSPTTRPRQSVPLQPRSIDSLPEDAFTSGFRHVQSEAMGNTPGQVDRRRLEKVGPSARGRKPTPVARVNGCGDGAPTRRRNRRTGSRTRERSAPAEQNKRRTTSHTR